MCICVYGSIQYHSSVERNDLLHITSSLYWSINPIQGVAYKSVNFYKFQTLFS